MSRKRPPAKPIAPPSVASMPPQVPHVGTPSDPTIGPTKNPISKPQIGFERRSRPLVDLRRGGAVAPFPEVPFQTGRADFPASGLPMVFSRSMHASRISYGAQQLIETVFLHQPAVRPLARVKRHAAGLPTSLTATPRKQP